MADTSDEDNTNQNYLLFSDESGYNGGHRFGAIGVVSGSWSNTRELNEELQSVLTKYGKKELKFANVKGHHSASHAALEFISTGLKFCSMSKIKIHIIIWDSRDSRHQVQGIKRNENLKRMYYHILKRALADWKGIANWEFFPDEFTAINWESDIIKYIERTNLDKKKSLDEETIFQVVKGFRFPRIKKHGELKSDEYPILQLADLFTGLCRLSYMRGNTFNIWLSNEKYKNSLFPDLIECDASKNEIHKFQLLKHFKDTCSTFTLGVNFSKHKYFTTFNSDSGIIIWLYKPQGEYDKAPTKLVKTNGNI